MEESSKLKKLKMDDLHGILIVDEMNTKKKKPSKNEETFKA
jgi:hypothetical protein